MSASDPFGFRALLRQVEHALVQALALRAHPLDAALRQQEGRWRGGTVTLTVRAYSSSHLAWARFVEVTGPGIEIGNLLCLPRPAFGVPILGMDFVWTGAPEAIAVADLSPLSRDAPRDVTLARALEAAPSLLPAGALPGWAQRWFSSTPLFARVKPDDASRLEAAARPYVDAFIRGVRGTRALPERAEGIRVQQERYCRAHREEDSGLRMLGKLFGEAWAHRFLEEVLFPSPPAQDAGVVT